MSTLAYFLSAVMLVAILTFFAMIIRASRFARRNVERLPSLIDRSTWWMRLFVRDGYGPEVDQERVKHAWQLGLSVLAAFASIGLFALFGAD